MALLIEKQLLFIHINKSCGGVVTHNMHKNGKPKITGYHRTLEDMVLRAKNELNISRDKLKMFTLVRNPFDRMVSMFEFYKSSQWAEDFCLNRNELRSDFNAWIKFIYSESFPKRKTHSAINVFEHCFCNQLNWLKDLRGNLASDVEIHRVEHTDLQGLLESYGLKNLDVKTRIHPTNHEHYSKYYTQESIRLVAEHYREDLEYFDYDF